MSNITYRDTKGTPLSNSEVDANFRAVAVSAVEFVLDAGGSPLVAGMKGYLEVPFDCTITAWKLVSPLAGDAVVDIFSDSYATFGSDTSLVGGGTKPSLSASNKNTAVPFDWSSLTITAGNLVGISLVSVSGIKQLSLSLKVKKT